MTQLRKDLTLFGLTMIAVGSCVGSGIFITPQAIANHLPSGAHILGVWTLGGFISLTGALTFAELAGLFPKTGGVYHYLQEAYGKLAAFLYGWCTLTVITSGAIAALSLAFAEYLSFFFDFSPAEKRITALICIVTVTLANVFGVKVSQWFSNVFTVSKIIGIAFLILIAFIWGQQTFDQVISTDPIESMTASFPLALIGVLWSFGGWHHASYLAGEAKNASRTIPKAMMLGTLIVTIIYLLCNLSYLLIFDAAQIAESPAIAADAIGSVLTWGGPFVAILIAVSVFGTASIYTLTAPRLYFRMAVDGVFFKKLGSVHPRYQVPVTAIIVQSCWAVVLLLFWETFANLIGYVVFTDWVFMLFAGASVFIFRKKRPEAVRTYKTWGYPIVPLLFVAIVVWFIISVLIQEPLQALAGIALMGAGVIVYYVFKSKNKELKDESI